MPPESDPASFWSRVDRSAGPDGCWPWTGAKSRRYGSLVYRGRSWRAHRLAWVLTNGPLESSVLHRCDNPPCCNPRHLFVGDQKANMDDARRKGRWLPGRLGNQYVSRDGERRTPRVKPKWKKVGRFFAGSDPA